MNKYIQNSKLGISNIMQNALDWWNELPMVDLENNKGWANLVMFYYSNKNDCQDISIEQILYIYLREHKL